jgi:hypothetical protein
VCCPRRPTTDTRDCGPKRRAWPARRGTSLGGFAEGFKTVNRQVFIDTFTNYFFTKHYGHHPTVAALVHPALFQALVAMHAATRAGVVLSPAENRDLFMLSLRFEQEITVAPGVSAEIGKFDGPILRSSVCVRSSGSPISPKGTFLVFSNFADTDERIAKAVRSHDLAERAGWPRVEAAMRSYGVLPAPYWDAPGRFVGQMS